MSREVGSLGVASHSEHQSRWAIQMLQETKQIKLLSIEGYKLPFDPWTVAPRFAGSCLLCRGGEEALDTFQA